MSQQDLSSRRVRRDVHANLNDVAIGGTPSLTVVIPARSKEQNVPVLLWPRRAARSVRLSGETPRKPLAGRQPASETAPCSLNREDNQGI